ncbi:MAG: TlyA family RNA methyltransferase [Proteobacteria bacterium]|nr:TlyA family RNA methyltransferase [Pseudomonadota bacterium]
MSRPSPVRLDLLLVKRGLAASRQRARELIENGKVKVDGIIASKPSMQVRPDRPILMVGDDFNWVGRGALKLLGAIEPFGVDPTGWITADLGASTGGFTQVLLEKGAVKVYAVDVGKGQIAWSLRTDPRVVVMEGVNARHLETLPEPIDLIVGDLSFISLSLILPTVARLLRPGGEAVLLVKPQFEAGREAIGKGGKVRSDEEREAAIASVRNSAEQLGFETLGSMDCTVAGAKAGNVEHFLHLRLPSSAAESGA